MNEDRARRELNEMIGKQYCYEHAFPEERINEFFIEAKKDLVTITSCSKVRYHRLLTLQQELTKYIPYVETAEIPTNDNWRINPTTTMDRNTDIVISEQAQEGAPGTLSELRKQLLQNIKDIKDGTLPLDKAKEIVSHAHAIVNITKVEVDLMKLRKYQEQLL